MTKHLADDCAHAVVPCEYLNAGCSFKVRILKSTTILTIILNSRLV